MVLEPQIEVVQTGVSPRDPRHTGGVAGAF